MACDRTVVLVPVGEPHDAPVRQSCTLGDDPWQPVWEVLEPSTRIVGDAELPVRHVRMTVDDDDEFWERLVADWYLAADGLPVEVTITKESRSPTVVGGVVYEEEYQLELVSAEPLR